MSIVKTTRRLLDGASIRVGEFARNRQCWHRYGRVERARCLFGLDRLDSSLMQPRLEWKMSLSERIATETLARLLNAGGCQARALRIDAFLRALGLGDGELGAAIGQLNSAQVFSEVPALDGRRIDLKFVWRDAKDKEKILVVEAKFDHEITPGQLRCYRESAKKDHPKAKRYHLVLALHESAMLKANCRGDGNWRFCSWRDLWLRFETARPVEYDQNLQLFLNVLWRRIGRLNPKDAHAPL
ncbi:PD-(D/E)XK nuclease family protein [Thioclava sp. SK-1]|uniref:PD-(D/E)XK nuclease family protein n=1 Tax=Thioclava sp. SK-1 TaxID=1889770 RepID=UPI00159F1562|nr:PD-(D/E)XK nuclease family protein [Thioclava sp. SK-1]